MDPKPADIKGADIPISKMVPLYERNVPKKGYNKIMASIKAIGLIEPICVYQDGDQFTILDGYLRYKVCLELGIETIPCLILPEKEAYTCSRMVNPLSPVQESRMLLKSLETLDEKTVASTLGLVSINHRINESLLQKLHPNVIAAFDKGRILKTCAEELTLVTPDRQAEILKKMVQTDDFSTSYVRTLILRTPAAQRSKRKTTNNPWDKNAKTKKALVDKLEHAENRYDFFAGVYQQYVTDLMKLCIYARKIISNTQLNAYMKASHAEMLSRIEAIVSESDVKGKPVNP